MDKHKHKQGIAIVQWSFVLFYCVLGVVCFLAIAQAVLSGSAGVAIMYVGWSYLRRPFSFMAWGPFSSVT